MAGPETRSWLLVYIVETRMSMQGVLDACFGGAVTARESMDLSDQVVVFPYVPGVKALLRIIAAQVDHAARP
ncbi:hypothetical protein N7488_012362 [Penicillium malachiteum]|nr:hypothetical protein N7488_012362 [Penicillium malachiteum]